jgi:hypothetical protein
MHYRTTPVNLALSEFVYTLEWSERPRLGW